MHPTFSKLNAAGHAHLYVLNAPESFAGVLADGLEGTGLHTALQDSDQPTFVLSFLTTQAGLDAFALTCARQAQGDAVVWVAYPKGSSRRYRCEFNRDQGWATFGQQGFEPVRQVAIDEDWSALRLRRVGFIRTLRRAGAISEEGQARVARRDQAAKPPA
ncbi:hypothetical protein [Deinococcus hohokamensis]|uniref:DUF3052 domain-containing protein n=1 Tax=Deinococcus hohokamensis TaxID=309883 RepID=A0ABV9I5N9_9DEIO